MQTQTETTRVSSYQISNLLVFGFIHDIESKYNLYMIIPVTIYDIILLFYPTLMKFELYDSKYFELLNDGYEIKGIGKDCSGFTIYPQVLISNGYSQGIHFFSVQFIKQSRVSGYCFHNIGVVLNKRDKQYLSKYTDVWQQRKNDTLYYDGHEYKWKGDQIMTIKLNCDNATIHFYKDTECVKKGNIDNTQSYFFALNSCASKDNWFKIVETPKQLLKQ